MNCYSRVCRIGRMGRVAICLLLLGMTLPASAVEVAPRISDREIIESLAELREGQKALNQKIDTEVAGLHQKIDTKIAALEQKIDTKTAELNARIDALDQKIDTKTEALDQKIEAQGAMMQARFDDLQKSMDYLWGVMVVMLAGIFGLIGFVVWDRKTALKPLEQRMVRLEQEMHEVHAELQAQHGEAGLLHRIVQALRALAAEDERIARVLRQCSLL